MEPGIVMHNCKPSTQEDHEFKASVSYIVRPCLKERKRKGGRKEEGRGREREREKKNKTLNLIKNINPYVQEI
jgi:hypothetical protein